MKKLEKKDVKDIYALTPMQEGLLFHYLQDPESELYIEQLTLDISGEIDVEIFKRAWNFVIQTNEMLRTVFRWENSENPVQIVLKEYKFQPGYYDFLNLAPQEKNVHVEALKVKERKMG